MPHPRPKKPKAQTSQDPLRVLPEELVYRIFGLVLREKWTSGITVLPLVAKSWNACCNKESKLWDVVRLDLHSVAQPSEEARCLAWLARRLQTVQQLSISLKYGQFFKAFWPGLTGLLLASRLEVLIIDVSSEEWRIDGIGKVGLEALARLSSLRVLKLTRLDEGLSAIQDFRHLNNLEELFVEFDCEDRVVKFPAGLCSLSKLRKLIICAIDEPNLTLPAEMSLLTELEVLHIHGYLIVSSSESPLSLLPPLPALKMLAANFEENAAVIYPNSLTTLSLEFGGFHESLVSCTGLRQLELIRQDLTTEEAHTVIDRMTVGLKQLRRVTVDVDSVIDEHLFELSTVEVLHVDLAERAFVRQVEEKEIWSNLRVLYADYMPQTILSKATSLQKLSICKLYDFSAQAIISLPQLQELYLPPLEGLSVATVRDFMRIARARKDVDVHVGSPVDCGSKDADLLDLIGDISTCYLA